MVKLVLQVEHPSLSKSYANWGGILRLKHLAVGLI